MSVQFRPFFLSSYRFNVVSCNLCARVKVKGHRELKKTLPLENWSSQFNLKQNNLSQAVIAAVVEVVLQTWNEESEEFNYCNNYWVFIQQRRGIPKITWSGM